jgi:hypothetical protein
MLRDGSAIASLGAPQAHLKRDAVMTGANAGTVHCCDENEKFPVQSSASTQGLGLSETISLARASGFLPVRLRMYGIEAKQFEPGTEVSPAVTKSGGDVSIKDSGRSGDLSIYRMESSLLPDFQKRSFLQLSERFL